MSLPWTIRRQKFYSAEFFDFRRRSTCRHALLVCPKLLQPAGHDRAEFISTLLEHIHSDEQIHNISVDYVPPESPFSGSRRPPVRRKCSASSIASPLTPQARIWSIVCETSYSTRRISTLPFSITQ